MSNSSYHEAQSLAATWRETMGYIGKGGVVVVFDGVANGWMNELRDPQNWQPGCIAADEAGNVWIAQGGNDYDGAERWEPTDSGPPLGDDFEHCTCGAPINTAGEGAK